MTKDEAFEIIVKAKNERNNLSKLISRIRLEFVEKKKPKKPTPFYRNGQFDRTIEMIAKVICDYYKVTLADLKVKTRDSEIVYPRQLIIFFGYKDYAINKKYLGRYFGQDHSTAIHSIKKINNVIDTEIRSKEIVEELRKKIKENEISKPTN